MTLQEFYKTDWFLERPKKVQELFKQFPVNEEVFLRVGGDSTTEVYGVWIIGWDGDDEKGEYTARIQRTDSMNIFDYQVFGVQIKDILTLTQVKEQNLKIVRPF